ncbi:glycosyltransferase [Gillisia sp. Hel_I_29]|uniref:glycosyltransferase n=1 Tax=Gillisia sp. Hel_I_29 TaxID=1249975 RepID=UPI000ABC3F36|nr:glycosyltransferase [Gillisia sp. Hel_I_29]
MSILFICGCLETGKDGVGDYTQILARELYLKNIEVSIISYNDAFVKGATFREDGVLNILRLGIDLSAEKKIELAKQFVNANNPDLISLQFVPYAYHQKGLPWRLGLELSKIGKKFSWHIMFHELWVEEKDFKNLVISKIQEAIIKRLVTLLDPVLVHTSIPVYQKRLETIGIAAMPLPIYSNIKVDANQKHQDLNTFMITFFSQLSPRKEILSFLKMLIASLKREKISFKLLIVGGTTKAKQELEKQLKEIPQISNKIEQIGFLQDHELSKVIASTALGISPVPRHLLGKSGSVATFLSHGIPVAAPYVKMGHNVDEVGFFNTKMSKVLVIEPASENIFMATQKARTLSKIYSRSAIAEVFIEDLMLISNIQEINLNLIT